MITLLQRCQDMGLDAEIVEAVPEARHPTIAECELAGKGPGIGEDGKFHEGGLPNTPEERERFEAYMRGHCWYIGAYDSDIRAYNTILVRQLYGVWRDRGSLVVSTPIQEAN